MAIVFTNGLLGVLAVTVRPQTNHEDRRRESNRAENVRQVSPHPN